MRPKNFLLIMICLLSLCLLNNQTADAQIDTLGCNIFMDVFTDPMGATTLIAQTDLANATYGWYVSSANGLSYDADGQTVTLDLPDGDYYACAYAFNDVTGCEDCTEFTVGDSTPPDDCIVGYEYETVPNGIVLYGYSNLADPVYSWSADGIELGEGDSYTLTPPSNTEFMEICVTGTGADGLNCTWCSFVEFGGGTNPVDSCFVAFEYEIDPNFGLNLYGYTDLTNGIVYYSAYNLTTGDAYTGEGEEVYFPTTWGEYEVCASAYNDMTECDFYCEYITIGDNGPGDCSIFGIYSYPSDSLGNDLSHTLYAEINGALTGPISYLWTVDMGNGMLTTYEGPYPVIDFPDFGEYFVAVTVIDANGIECSGEEMILITEPGTGGGDCEVEFGYESWDGNLGLYGYSNLDNAQYLWYITGADGNTYTFEGEDVVTADLAAGNYTVCLLAYSNMNECEYCQDVTVNGGGGNPVDTLVVWPGDANNDGIANNEDLLNIGIAYGIDGSERWEQGNAWEEHYALSWDLFFANDVNLAYADCNGDGVINDDDFEAIDINYGETHGKTGSESEATADDPGFYVDLPENELSDGDELVAPIMLGDDNLDVEGFYGVAFTVNFDVEIFDPASVQINIEDSWIGVMEDILLLQKVFPEDGRIEMAVTRKDQMNVSGAGSIGSMIGIIDNIAGKNEAVTEFTVEITNIRAIGSDEEEIILNAVAETGYVEGGTSIETLYNDLTIYPNPATDVLFIDGLTEEVTNITITDLQGRTIINTTNIDSNSIDISDLDAGVYLLTIQTAEGSLVDKVTVR